MRSPPRLTNESGKIRNRTVKISTNLLHGTCNIPVKSVSCMGETLNRSSSDPDCQSGIETSGLFSNGRLSDKTTPHCSITDYHHPSRSHKQDSLIEALFSIAKHTNEIDPIDPAGVSARLCQIISFVSAYSPR